jgi:DNA helicase HerA-like ATPase
MIYDMLTNRAMNEHIAPAINKLRQSEKDISRVFNSSNNITDFWGDSNLVVIDLSNVNTDTKKRIPLLLSNKLYNEHKGARKTKSYLNIVIDEAHNILSHQSTRESEEWKDYRLEVFEEIVKEGRKFGVFMTIASQRPSDISSTIISQLHNYFIHRLVNEEDLRKIYRTIAFSDKSTNEMIPILPAGGCVFAGLASNFPVLARISILPENNQPQSENVDIKKIWY